MPVAFGTYRNLHSEVDPLDYMNNKDTIWVMKFRIQFLLSYGDVLGGPTIHHLVAAPQYICIFTANVDEMFDQIEMVFQWLKSFNLNIKPKNAFL